MTKILVDIYKHNFLGNKLGFKGGTACYFFYDLPRFSVDLDFNLISLDNEDNDRIVEEVTKLLSKYGKIKHEHTKRRTLFWLLNYEKQQWNLKIEVSLRDYSDEYDLKELLGISMLVLKKENIFAHKLVALTDRKFPVGRDVFDINYFLEQEWNFLGRIIEERTGKTVKKYLQSLPKFINSKFSNKTILDGVGELLSASKRDHYKSKLLEDVTTNLKILEANYEAYVI